MKVRAMVLQEARSWLTKHMFNEVQGPVIIPAIADWKSYFRLKYNDIDAFLAQGLGPYAQVFIANLGNIYSISPSFRVEITNGSRHLTEYWLIELGIKNGTLEDIIEIQERLFTHICQHLNLFIEESEINKAVDRLKSINPPFPRLTYDEAIHWLQNEGYTIEWGATLEYKHETVLSNNFETPFFISRFPIGMETYYYRTDPENSLLTLSVDLLVPETYGEISTGGEPAVGLEMLEKMKDDEMSFDEQNWYGLIEEMGSTPHSGCAIGVERLVQWVCNLELIEDTIAFPRLPHQLYP